MESREEPVSTDYPHGRGYGHDYMRGGEVLGGYGYSEREEYQLRRGDTGEFQIRRQNQEEERGQED